MQGLRPFANSIPKNLKKYLKKGGYNYSHIVDNWTGIVNKEISDSCYPDSIKMGKELKNGILTLNVIHGKEIDVEYRKNEILDKINSFFGYNCINRVVLKIVQEKIKEKRLNFPKIKNSDEIVKKIEKVKNEGLKNSLNSFLRAYNQRNE